MKAILPYIKLVGHFPLHFTAAYISGLLFAFLFALQPTFLKLFINESQRGVHSEHLMVIGAFMAISLVLAFLFDTIQVSIATALKLKIETYLRSVHFQHAKGLASMRRDLAIRKGLYGLTEFSMQVTLDLLLVLSNFIIIATAMILESPTVGGAILGLSLIGIWTGAYWSGPLGRIGKFKELAKGRMINSSHVDQAAYDSQIERLQSFELKRFGIDTFLVFVSFLIFRMCPAIMLIYLASRSGSSLGGVASLILYFGLLHGPYTKFTTLIKTTAVNFTQTELFRESLECGMIYEDLSKVFPTGLLWFPGQIKDTTPLSQIENHQSAHIFHDDLGENTPKSDYFERLKKRAQEELIMIYSKDKRLSNYAHLYYGQKDHKIHTILTYEDA